MPIQPQLPAAPINTPWIDPSTGSVSWQWRQWMNQFQQGMGYDSSAVAFGPDAQSQNDGVAVGQGSDTGSGTGNVVVGQGSTIANSLNNCTIVGQGTSITAQSSQTMVGQGVSGSGLRATGIGQGITIAGDDSTGVGQGVVTGSGAGNTAIGVVATTRHISLNPSAAKNTAVGYGAQAYGNNSVGVGYTALAVEADSVAIGYLARSGLGPGTGGAQAISIGRSGSAQGDRSIAIGGYASIASSYTDSIVIGSSLSTEAYKNAVTASSQIILGTNQSLISVGRGVNHGEATAQSTTIRASDGSTDLNLSNKPGDNLILSGGQPTGNAVPGILAFYTSIAGASGSSLRVAAERMRVHTNGNVGIGSTAPAKALHVKGDSATNTAQVVVEGASDTQKTYLGMFSGGAYWSAGGTYSGSWAADGTNAIAAILLQANNADATIGFYTTDTNNATPTERVRIDKSGGVNILNTIVKYNNIATNGLGVPAIYKSGRSTAQTAAVASVAAYTNGATDGSFIISANANVTTSTTHNFTVTVAYTDETNTARTLTLSFFALSGGAPISSITNVTGAGPYEGAPVHIRCKASTSITIATTGTFTSVTYNVEGYITQIG